VLENAANDTRLGHQRDDLPPVSAVVTAQQTNASASNRLNAALPTIGAKSSRIPLIATITPVASFPGRLAAQGCRSIGAASRHEAHAAEQLRREANNKREDQGQDADEIEQQTLELPGVRRSFDDVRLGETTRASDSGYRPSCTGSTTTS
jgi:hypothetical protein